VTTPVFFLLLLCINAALVVAGVRHLRSLSNPQSGDPVAAAANANATTLITIELLNPLQLAEQRQGLVARLAGVVAPGPIKRMVHDTVANMIREQLASEGAHADVRIVSQEPPKVAPAKASAAKAAPVKTERPVPTERHERTRDETRKPHHPKSHHSKSRSSSSRGRTRPLVDDALVIVPEHATGVLTPAFELAGERATATL
jgi:hypothetical protein